jgi:hypothetical protein
MIIKEQVISGIRGGGNVDPPNETWFEAALPRGIFSFSRL